MDDKSLYVKYHKGRNLQKRVISEKNFTYRNIIEVLNNIKFGNQVLDIGSGVGTIGFYLASQGKQVTGIEIAQEAVTAATKSARLMGLEGKIDFIKGDFLKWEDERKFDFVICSEVLEHLRDDNKALVNIYQLLKKDGLLLVTVPSKNAPLYRLSLAGKFDKRVGHLRRYQMKEIASLLKKNQFRILRKKKTEGILRNSLFVFRVGNFPNRLANKFPLISDFLTLIDNIFLKLFGESNIIVVCKKV